MREIVQMQKARDIITQYDGRQPLQLFLKNYFRNHKEMGSRDRKLYTQLAFGYFREKGKQAHHDRFLVDAVAHNEQFHAFYSYWNEQIAPVVAAPWENYFPLTGHISAHINQSEINTSIHSTPATFIRCKKNHITEVIDELSQKGYPFERKGTCIRFESNFPLQETESFANGYFEVQDIASQQTATFMHPEKNSAWWDCCAGSGGKSLLLLEQEKQIQLFVSDSREQILHNLQDRFNRAGIRQFAAIIADLEQDDAQAFNSIPDMQGVIADVPCSGSGTWARSPERMSFFDSAELETYVAKQRRIVERASGKLLSGGQFLYITCSIFAEENEHQVEWMQKHLPLTLKEQQYFQYSSQGGDTLFAALLMKK